MGTNLNISIYLMVRVLWVDHAGTVATLSRENQHGRFK